MVFLLDNLREAEKELLLLSEAKKAHSLASVMALKRVVSMIDGRVWCRRRRFRKHLGRYT